MGRIMLRFQVRLSLAAILFAAIMITGCAAVGPDYKPPDTSLPQSWKNVHAPGFSQARAEGRAFSLWWDCLKDPVLTDLVEASLRGSPGIREAAARVQEARARRGISRTGLLPSLDLSADAAFSGELESERSKEGTSRRFSSGFDAGWELDLFGGVRRSVEAAEADLQASEANLRDAWVTLAAEIAVTYMDIRIYQARLAVARANLEAQQDTFSITSARQEAGIESELAVQQARYSLESTRARIPTLEAGLEAALNGLAVLQGQPPGTLHDALKESDSMPVPPKEIAVGIPADALRQRPDLRKAERELAAVTARIGEAEAELYPKIRLRGSIGVETLNLVHPGATAAWPFGYGLSIQWPVFDAGRINRNVEVQKALQEQALARYESTVLDALKEVESTLSAYAMEKNRLDALYQAAGAAQEAVTLARTLYESGLVDFNNVLEARRSLLGFQDQVVESEGSVVIHLIRLYKALGGGWQSMTLTGGYEENMHAEELNG